MSLAEHDSASFSHTNEKPMIQNSLVSVIMPVFNGERHISLAINSMLSQHYDSWELIIVDDGSTDETSAIVKSIGEPRIKYHFQENRGQAAALNRGLDLAKGEFITTLDCDDWYTVNSLSDRVSLMKANPDDDVVYGDGLYCDESGKPIHRFSELMPGAVEGDVFDDIVVTPFFGTGATVMIRHGALMKNRMRYDEAIVWCQDWDYYIRLAEELTFRYRSSLLVHYRVHVGGMTAAMPEGNRLDSLITLRNKVLVSPRFESVANSQKRAFFYDFIVRDLENQTEEQGKVFDSPQFQTLPHNEQARLLRLAALTYIARAEHHETAKNWLIEARSKAPADIKTSLALTLMTLSPFIARVVIRAWQRNGRNNSTKSPFDMAVSAE